MASNLFIYSKALNAGNGVYNINATNGTTYLNTYLVHSAEVDSYRINSNTLKLQIGGETGIAEGDINKCVYVYWATTGTFYFIDNYVIQSGYVLFYLSKDLWGTYFKKALLSNLCYGRTNMKITGANAIYDSIKIANYETVEFVENDMQKETGQPDATVDDIYFSHLSVLFSLKYNIWEDPLLNKASISEVQMFALPLSRLITTYETLIGDKNINILDLVRESLGGIYAIDDGNNEYKAEVMGVWIVENDIATTGSTGYRIKFRTGINLFWDNEIDIDWVNPYKASSMRYVRYFTITQDCQHEYYFGTYNMSMKLPRFVGETYIAVKYIIENDKVSVILQCGSEEKDITSAFGLTVSHLDGDIRNTTAILNAMQSGLKMVGAGTSAMIGITKGGEYGATLGALGMASNIGDLAQANTRMGGLIDSGDAYTTYWRSGYASNGLVRNPFVLHKFNSMCDEEEFVSHKGAIYEFYSGTNLLSELTNADPIVEYDPNVYVKCSEVTVDGVPSEAREYITNKLMNGIYLINEA